MTSGGSPVPRDSHHVVDERIAQPEDLRAELLHRRAYFVRWREERLSTSCEASCRAAAPSTKWDGSDSFGRCPASSERCIKLFSSGSTPMTLVPARGSAAA